MTHVVNKSAGKSAEKSADKHAILIADDSDLDRLLLTHGLELEGHKVTPASSGKQALALAAEMEPDLILLDVLMPEMSGYEVCRRLKTDPRLRNIPVIFLSAMHDTADKVKGFEAGGVDYLTKPFALEDLFARVMVHLNLYQQRKQFEKELGQREIAEVALRQEQMSAQTLLNSALALSSTLLLDEVLDHVLEDIEQIVPHDLAMVILVENESGSVVRVRSKQEVNWQLPTPQFPLMGTGIVEAMLANHRPYMISDIRVKPLWKELPEHHSLCSFIGMPIFTDGRLVAVLGLMAELAGFYHEAVLQRLETYSVLVTLAFKNARLYEQARELAVVQERQRLARELHDSVSQTLFSANALAEVLPRIIDVDGVKARRYMTDLAQFTREAMAEMRSLLIELRPEAFKGVEFGVLVKQLCELFTMKTGINTEFRQSERIFLSEKEQIVFYRVAQETLNSAGSHANATEVFVSLFRQPDGVELRIQINGDSFDQQGDSSAQGVYVLHERASSIGATLTIDSQPGQGTTVILRGAN